MKPISQITHPEDTMPYISRPTEDAVERRLDAQERLRAIVRRQPPICDLDHEFLKADIQSPTGGAYLIARKYRLPLAYVERRLQLFTAVARLEELKSYG